ncbi:uncharacterized protein UV8b_02859 [Ustilaginoidea virens]|uniref:Uncharacterized protein n=2 Tax=Ustilaginoidea virens TaxID=1159556 RepID=A0A8E5MFP0_USTVR|nr:uncharacterized protein UV8b_02859 [Ustilaginoidea virens]QUC18618.1 hypothetical protein UV8b_02859 [Ustilaginoidea virens]
MTRQAAASALGSIERYVFHMPSLPLATRRPFSSTTSRSVRAVFSETENDELRNVLKMIQEKIILPAYLPEKQRRIVFDPKKRSYLEQNPIIIEVDGLEHKFSSIDRFKDVENSKKALSRALEHMHTPEDWTNLGPLLAGYRRAGIRLKAKHLGKIVRVAGTRGQIFAVIECAKQSDKTGFTLKNPEVVARVFAFINDKISKAARETPDGPETKQALTWTEMVLDLLQRPEHTVDDAQTRQRLHFSPLVRGMTLFARASAARLGAASERDLNLLRDEVALLVSLWGDAANKDLLEVAEIAKLTPAAERDAAQKSNYIPRALNVSSYVQVLAQNIKGIEIAQEILGDEAQGLSAISTALTSHLRDFAGGIRTKSDMWVDEYEKVMGAKPSWLAVGDEAV